jgi:hypothetical protein
MQGNSLFDVRGSVPNPDHSGPAFAIGEFKYLTQGIAQVGDINLAFTFLTNAGQETVVKDALGMTQRASQCML